MAAQHVTVDDRNAASGRRSRRGLVVLGGPAVAAVLVVGLAACSGSTPTALTAGTPSVTSSPAGSGSAVSTSSTAAASSGSPSGSSSGSPSAATGQDQAAGLGLALGRRVQGAMRAKQTVVMTMTTSAGGKTVSKGSGVLRYLADGIEMSVRMTVGSQSMRMVVVPNAFYIAAPQKTDGKTWVKIGSDSGNATLASLVDSVTRSTSSDALVKNMAAVRVKDLGTATVNGVKAHTYTWTLTEKELLAQLTPAQRTAFGSALAGASSTSTLYVDDKDLPVQQVTVSANKNVRTTTVVTYTKWGTPVTIAIPAAKDVATLPSS